ncbi:MAG: DUF4976 domain-containing protein, partial [Planctomycetes bacterium]|nr:DUF4976 domain-containing protein [Planctomycetota bacterium]
GGIRVPQIVCWPDVVAAGKTCEEPVITLDLYPTLLEIAGVPVEKSFGLDGASLMPLLKDARATLNRDALFWHFPGYLQADASRGSWRTTPAGAIRSGDFKLLEFFEDDHVELYNLAEDPGEKTDLAEAQPEKRRELHARLQGWRQDVNAPMPQAKTLSIERNP